MGLDQYIFRGHERREDNRFVHGEEVAYFRKVNFLHSWVQDHLNGGADNNCTEIPFHLEAMAGLMRTCQQVLVDPNLGPKLLPTMSGFFFGATTYDDYYLGDVRDVLEALVKILDSERDRHPSSPGQYVYYSSW